MSDDWTSARGNAKEQRLCALKTTSNGPREAGPKKTFPEKASEGPQSNTMKQVYVNNIQHATCHGSNVDKALTVDGAAQIPQDPISAQNVQTQKILLKQQNKKRLLTASQEQDKDSSQVMPPPSVSRTGPSPDLHEQIPPTLLQVSKSNSRSENDISKAASKVMHLKYA